MCRNFETLLFTIFLTILEVFGQVVQPVGNLNGGYLMYPQYGQQYIQGQYSQLNQYNPQYIPYPYGANQRSFSSQAQPIPNSVADNGVKTEIIDIDSQAFRNMYYPRNRPVDVVQRKINNSQQQRGGSRKTPYVVKVDTKQYNNTVIPKLFNKHETQHKVYTFNKTYVIGPGDREKVISLNFLNGVPVTDGSATLKDETTSVSPTITEKSTTESDNPVSVNNWFF